MNRLSGTRFKHERLLRCDGIGHGERLSTPLGRRHGTPGDAPQLAREISATRTVSATLAIAEARLHHFDGIHATACLHRVARLSRQAGAWSPDQSQAHVLTLLLQLLTRLAVGRGGACLDSSAVAINLWSIATLSATAECCSVSGPLATLKQRLVAAGYQRLFQMDAKGCAPFAWAVAQLPCGVGETPQLTMLSTSVLQRLPESAPQGLANSFWALGPLGCTFSGPLAEAFTIQARRLTSQFNAQDVASICWAMAKSHIVAPSLMITLASEAQRKVNDFGARHLSNTAWSLATRQIEGSHPLMVGIARPTLVKVRDFSVTDLAAACWAFAASIVTCTAPAQGEHRLAEALAEQAMHKAPELGVSGMVGLTWALAVLQVGGWFSPAMLALAWSSASSELAVSHVARLLWSAATLRQSDSVQVQVLLMRASETLPAFRSQDLANLSWALSTARWGARNSLMAAVAAMEGARSDDWMPPHLMQIAWASAPLCHYDEQLAAALRKQVTSGAFECQLSDLAIAAWAFAVWQEDSATISASFREEVLKRRAHFGAQDLSNMAWALSVLNVRDTTLLATIAAEARRKLPQFEPQHLCNTVWALAELGWRCKAAGDDVDVVRGLSLAVTRRLSQMPNPGLSATAWALASLVGLNRQVARAFSRSKRCGASGSD